MIEISAYRDVIYTASMKRFGLLRLVRVCTQGDGQAQCPLIGDMKKFRSCASTKEKRIAFHVFPPALAVVFPRVEFLPDASRKYMFIPFIPTSIHYFGEIRVVFGTFEAYKILGCWNAGICTFGWLRCCFQRIVCLWRLR